LQVNLNIVFTSNAEHNKNSPKIGLQLNIYKKSTLKLQITDSLVEWLHE